MRRPDRLGGGPAAFTSAGRGDACRPGERRDAGLLGFTLLEVMVAVAILGLSLTVILSSQVGLFQSGTYGQHVTVAIGLGRCKMTELEEQLLKLGYPEVDSADEGACCNLDTRLDMKCQWKVERVELPNPIALDTVASSSPLGSASPFGSAGLDLSTPPPGTGIDPASPLSNLGSMGPLGALQSAGINLPGGSTPGGTSGLSSMLMGAASGGAQGLAPMVMSLVYPSLKPMLETSIRKVTVDVQWKEGLAQRDLELIQWVTNPMKSGFLSDALGSDSANNPLGNLLGGGVLGGGPSPTQGAQPLGGGVRK